MPKYKIKAEVVVTYIYDVDADSIEEAIASVEDGGVFDDYEVDRILPLATEYATKGQMGWNIIEENDNET